MREGRQSGVAVQSRWDDCTFSVSNLCNDNSRVAWWHHRGLQFVAAGRSRYQLMESGRDWNGGFGVASN
jgi:hypothetical protein